MIKLALSALTLASACGSGGGPIDAYSQTFSLSGRLAVLDPVTLPARMVVGVAPVAPLEPVRCEQLIVRLDTSISALPASYALEGIPQGYLYLIGIVLDGSEVAIGLAHAEPGILLDVRPEGIRVLGNFPTNEFDFTITGRASYDCP